MGKWILLFLVGLILAAGAAFWYLNTKQDLKKYAVYLTPQIENQASLRVLVVEGSGTPDQIAAKAIPKLMQAFFSLQGATRNKDIKFTTLRARWPKPLNTPPNEWVGQFAMDLPLSIESLPPAIAKSFPEAKLETWEYGDTAKILHLGPYDQETPTIHKLDEFVQKSGYVKTGVHEEVYLKGPGMFGKGNPEKYRTLIVYPVKKVGKK